MASASPIAFDRGTRPGERRFRHGGLVLIGAVLGQLHAAPALVRHRAGQVPSGTPASAPRHSCKSERTTASSERNYNKFRWGLRVGAYGTRPSLLGTSTWGVRPLPWSTRNYDKGRTALVLVHEGQRLVPSDTRASSFTTRFSLDVVRGRGLPRASFGGVERHRALEAPRPAGERRSRSVPWGSAQTPNPLPRVG
jgi:hypothetical protein